MENVNPITEGTTEPDTPTETPKRGNKKQPAENVYTKLLTVMAEIGAYVKKDKSNTQQKYTYVSEGAILKKVQPALVAAKLISYPNYSVISQQETATSKGSIWQLCTVECKLTIVCADTNTTIECVALGQGTDNGDKAMAKAMTQAFKYAWWKLLCLETGDDPEADNNTDKQDFVKQVDNLMANNVAVGQQLHTVTLESETPMNDLAKIFQINGWDVNGLSDYICKRFNKDLQYITVFELRGLLKELFNYSRQRGINIHDDSNVPF